MGENEAPRDLQEAVERSYREQWGGRRFCVGSAIVLFILAVAGAAALVVVHRWFINLTGSTLTTVEISALSVSFVCLIGAVLFMMEALIRLQRERGQLPDRTIHAALSLSMVTVAGLAYLFFLSLSPMSESLARILQIIRFILLLFCGLVWLGSVAANAAAVTLIATRRSDLLEVNNTAKGTALVFRRGHSAEIMKLCVAAFIPLIIFVVAILLVGVAWLFP